VQLTLELLISVACLIEISNIIFMNIGWLSKYEKANINGEKKFLANGYCYLIDLHGLLFN